MLLRFYLPLVALLLLNYCPLLRAQDVSLKSIEELDLSYVYAPIFGTGFYRAGAEEASVLKVDVNSWLMDQSKDDEWFWLLPVSAGVRYTELEDIVGEVLSGSLLNLSFLPGVARRYQIDDQWEIVPSVQLGFARDISLNTTRGLYTAAVRSTNWWMQGENRWTFGNRLRLAGQKHPSNGKAQGFFLLESGFDWERQLDYEFMGDPLLMSTFLYGQYFIEDTGIKAASGEPVGAQSLYNLGITVGWRTAKEVMGFSIQRVGMSVALGNNVRAYMFNIGFPLSLD